MSDSENRNDLLDKTGVRVEVSDDSTRGAFAITIADGDDSGEVAGRTYYIDRGDDRIFFHTVVDERFGGRGLGTILVREALAATREGGEDGGRNIVPICPMVAGYLEKHGEEFAAAGGRVRAPRDEDTAAVRERGRR